ncbi:MAG: hypothetical protein NTW33_00460, partial [Methanoregula sp.]|nr:hypothetical protein [Methanoregula sp.]
MTTKIIKKKFDITTSLVHQLNENAVKRFNDKFLVSGILLVIILLCITGPASAAFATAINVTIVPAKVTKNATIGDIQILDIA